MICRSGTSPTRMASFLIDHGSREGTLAKHLGKNKTCLGAVIAAGFLFVMGNICSGFLESQGEKVGDRILQGETKPKVHIHTEANWSNDMFAGFLPDPADSHLIAQVNALRWGESSMEEHVGQVEKLLAGQGGVRADLYGYCAQTKAITPLRLAVEAGQEPVTILDVRIAVEARRKPLDGQVYYAGTQGEQSVIGTVVNLDGKEKLIPIASPDGKKWSKYHTVDLRPNETQVFDIAAFSQKQAVDFKIAVNIQKAGKQQVYTTEETFRAPGIAANPRAPINEFLWPDGWKTQSVHSLADPQFHSGECD
jgi:hypothetical protein